MTNRKIINGKLADLIRLHESRSAPFISFGETVNKSWAKAIPLRVNLAHTNHSRKNVKMTGGDYQAGLHFTYFNNEWNCVNVCAEITHSFSIRKATCSAYLVYLSRLSTLSLSV